MGSFTRQHVHGCAPRSWKPTFQRFWNRKFCTLWQKFTEPAAEEDFYFLSYPCTNRGKKQTNTKTTNQNKQKKNPHHTSCTALLLSVCFQISFPSKIDDDIFLPICLLVTHHSALCTVLTTPKIKVSCMWPANVWHPCFNICIKTVTNVQNTHSNNIVNQLLICII